MKLIDWAPREFRSEYRDTRAFALRDQEVVLEFGLGDDDNRRSWPGPEKNVMNWCVLANGNCVGWNENVSRGWSFPVLKREIGLRLIAEAQ